MGKAGVDGVEILALDGVVLRLLQMHQLRIAVHHVGGLDLFRVADGAEAQLAHDVLGHVGRVEDLDGHAELALGALRRQLHPDDVDDAVAVEQDDLVRAVVLERGHDVVAQIGQHFGPDGDGAGAHHVVRTPAVPDGRGDDGAGLRGGVLRQRDGDEAVRPDGQVERVLLGAADGDDDHTLRGLKGVARLLPAHILKPV